MAKSFGRSIDISSDVIPDHYCEPCFEVNREIKPIAGYCRDCNDELCQECYSSHLGPKPFRHHKLVDKSTRPKTKPTCQAKPRNTGEECLLHHGETLQSFCQDHSKFCCKVCLKINHQGCQTEKISKLAKNIQDSSVLKTLNKKLDSLKKGFNDNLSKTGANEINIQKNYREAINDMKKLRDQFDKLITETEKLFDTVKEKDFEKIENASSTCDMVIEQIDKLTTNLDTLKGKGASEQLFIAMKRAESQLKSFEETLDKLNEDNTATEYKFESDEKMKARLNELQVLGKLSYLRSPNVCVTKTKDRVISISDQMTKTPTHVKDILVKSSSENKLRLRGSLVLLNKQILITDSNNKKVKLIDTNQNKIMSELQLPGDPIDITKVNEQEVAVTVQAPNTIQFVSVFQHSLSKGRSIKLDGVCKGIVYNDNDKTLIVVYGYPVKVEILDMSGNVIKCLDKDKTGKQLFKGPFNVALTPDRMSMYITDSNNHSVILMTMDGDVKAEYKDVSLQTPRGICVHTSGLVYVVGYNSHTVHQLDTSSGKFKLLLDKSNGLKSPLSISYCDLENKMYIGMLHTDVLKVFQMK